MDMFVRSVLTLIFAMERKVIPEGVLSVNMMNQFWWVLFLKRLNFLWLKLSTSFFQHLPSRRDLHHIIYQEYSHFAKVLAGSSEGRQWRQ
jgi:hypothetical protein